jgi:hypothetical protein
VVELDRGRVRRAALLRLGGTDHRSHEEPNAAIAAHGRWRNARAQPKTNFATNSPIRTWTSYPAKAA